MKSGRRSNPDLLFCRLVIAVAGVVGVVIVVVAPSAP